MKIVKTAVFIVLFALLTACGGVGGNSTPPTTTVFKNTTSSGGPIGSGTPSTVATGDTVTVTTDTKTVTYNELNIGGTGTLYNPAVTASYYTNQHETIIRMVQNGGYSMLTIVTPGSSTGTFTVGVNGVSVHYNDFYYYTSYFTATSGTVIVTNYNAVNGLIEGTFDVTSTNQTTGGTTYHQTGSFKATRDADQVI